jgi:RNA polymerase sigma-70 factor, ECF subfamily
MSAPDLHAVLTRTLRADRGRLLAALIADLRHFDLAEEALADAVEAALTHWQRGIPDRPQGWLLRVARRKAIDRIRRQARWRDRVPDLEALAMLEQDEAPDISDERLRLIFTCCHPALDPKSRVALTLRSLGGLSTAEIARAFLDSEPAMGQRLSRAKAKIAAAGIPFAIPGPEHWDQRFASVLAVIYLIFNEGYAATAGDTLIRAELCDEAIFLARMLVALRADQAEAQGLLALLLITHARQAARSGGLVPLDRQDRALWDADMAAEGQAVLDSALGLRTPGPYQIKAAMSALHVQAGTYAQTDWAQMILLYDALFRFEPSPIVLLNRAVAVAETGAVVAALGQVQGLAEGLADYQPFHAVHADLLARTGAKEAALAAYGQAIARSGTVAERQFLAGRRDRLLH